MRPHVGSPGEEKSFHTFGDASGAVLCLAVHPFGISLAATALLPTRRIPESSEVIRQGEALVVELEVGTGQAAVAGVADNSR